MPLQTLMYLRTVTFESIVAVAQMVFRNVATRLICTDIRRVSTLEFALPSRQSAEYLFDGRMNSATVGLHSRSESSPSLISADTDMS